MDYTASQVHSTLVEQLHQAHNLLVNIAREITVSGYSDHVQTQAAERLVATLEKVYGSVGQYMCYQSAGEDEFKLPTSNEPLSDHDENEKVEDLEQIAAINQNNKNPRARSLQTPRLSLKMIEDNLRRPMSFASAPSPISECSRSVVPPASLIRRKPVPKRNRNISPILTMDSWETLINSGDGDPDFDDLVEPLNIKKRQLPDLKILIPEVRRNPVVCVINTAREDSPVLGTSNSFSLILSQ